MLSREKCGFLLLYAEFPGQRVLPKGLVRVIEVGFPDLILPLYEWKCRMSRHGPENRQSMNHCTSKRTFKVLGHPPGHKWISVRTVRLRLQ
jgi:hypothetical protein